MSGTASAFLLPLLAFAVHIAGFSLHQRLRQKKYRCSIVKQYKGRCHCSAVSFTVTAPLHLVVWDCDCSICIVKKNAHFIVPSSSFVIDKGTDKLTQYTFNTHTAKHLFCSVCGVQAFYRPRSNPDGVAVTLSCLEPQTQIESFEVRKFEGSTWERFISKSGIQKYSKEAKEEEKKS